MINLFLNMFRLSELRSPSMMSFLRSTGHYRVLLGIMAETRGAANLSMDL